MSRLVLLDCSSYAFRFLRSMVQPGLEVAYYCASRPAILAKQSGRTGQFPPFNSPLDGKGVPSKELGQCRKVHHGTGWKCPKFRNNAGHGLRTCIACAIRLVSAVGGIVRGICFRPHGVGFIHRRFPFVWPVGVRVDRSLNLCGLSWLCRSVRPAHSARSLAKASRKAFCWTQV